MLLETRLHQGTLDRINEFSRELVALKCSVIFAANPYAIRAVMKATSTIPIIGLDLDLESDPVSELGGKQIELLKEAVPMVARLAVLWDATIGIVQFSATEMAARPSGVALESIPIRSVEDIKG